MALVQDTSQLHSALASTSSASCGLGTSPPTFTRCVVKQVHVRTDNLYYKVRPLRLFLCCAPVPYDSVQLGIRSVQPLFGSHCGIYLQNILSLSIEHDVPHEGLFAANGAPWNICYMFAPLFYVSDIHVVFDFNGNKYGLQSDYPVPTPRRREGGCFRNKCVY